MVDDSGRLAVGGRVDPEAERLEEVLHGDGGDWAVLHLQDARGGEQLRRLGEETSERSEAVETQLEEAWRSTGSFSKVRQ